MGWICRRCGAENEFSRLFCIVCRFEPDKVFLRKELRAAKREKAAALKAVKRKTGVLGRDFLAVRRRIFRVNAAVLAMLLIVFGVSAALCGFFTSPDAKSILAGDFSQHQGLNRARTQAISCKQQLDESLAQLARTADVRFTALQSMEVSTTAVYASAALDTAESILKTRSSHLLTYAARSVSALPSPVRFVQELPQLVLQRIRQLVP